MTPANLPPGSTGLLRNGFDFVESRAQKHEPVFRTRILGRDTTVIVGSPRTEGRTAVRLLRAPS